MKTILMCGLAVLLLCSCSRDDKDYDVPPATTDMMYKDLNDTAVVFGRGASFDLDSNGTRDIYFSTQLVGDPIFQQDKRQYLAGSSFYTNLPVNNFEQVPLMKLNDPIPVANFNGYNWYNASTILLAQKIYTTNTEPYWEGPWKDAIHAYLPLQIMKGNGYYNGWVELSFHTAEEKVILHRAAVSKTANCEIKAGK